MKYYSRTLSSRPVDNFSSTEVPRRTALARSLSWTPQSHIQAPNNNDRGDIHTQSANNPHHHHHHDTDVLSVLYKRRLSDVEVDSPSRDPPPRCYPGTRTGLRTRVTNWATGSPRDPKVLWLCGPAGIGKSAIAQTVTEESMSSGILGAAVFFSKHTDVEDPTRIVSTLAYQLANNHVGYKRIIAERLVQDPTIVQKNLNLQFRELLVEPIWTIMIEGASTAQMPFLVILDGLDECADQELQCELIRLIGRYCLVDGFPLIWMISSRSEWHLEDTFLNSESPIPCLREELQYLGPKDVEFYLSEGFRQLARAYPNVVDQTMLRLTWPEVEDLHKIFKKAGNLFTAAVSILEFVGDSQFADPSMRLRTLIDCIDNPSFPVTMHITHPFASVDELYASALSRLPRPLLPVVLQIFAVWLTETSLTAHELANLLALERGTFYHVLRHLRGIVRFAHDDKYNRKFLRHVDPSFLDFLSSPRSGELYIGTASVSSAAARSMCSLIVKSRTDIARQLSWKSQPPHAFDLPALATQDLSVANRIFSSAVKQLWEFCTKTEEHQSSFWYEKFVAFDFRKLQYCCERIPVEAFIGFLEWLDLLAWRRRCQHLIVRTKPHYAMDSDFIEKCQSVAKPLGFRKNKLKSDNFANYVLLGVDVRTVLVMLTSESVTVYSSEYLDDL